jgi:hypothetical protein
MFVGQHVAMAAIPHGDLGHVAWAASHLDTLSKFLGKADVRKLIDWKAK